MSGIICWSRYRSLSGNAVRRNSLRCAVRPSYRFLRPRSRENLSPAGTSHFPRPWVGHVRRTAPPDGRHVDEENGVRKCHFLPRFRKFRKTVKNWADIYTVFFTRHLNSVFLFPLNSRDVRTGHTILFATIPRKASFYQ